jgi:hypothetical protein
MTVAAIACFILSAVCFCIWLRTLNAGEHQQGGLMFMDERNELTYENSSLPQLFNERAILQEMIRLAPAPNVLNLYVERLKQRFTARAQLEFLENKTRLYTSAAGVAEGHARLVRALNSIETARGEREVNYWGQQEQVEASKARISESRLKAAKAEREIQRLSRPEFQMSEDERKLHEARERVKLDAQWQAFMSTARTVTTLDGWQRWRAQAKRDVLHGPRRSPVEQEAMLELIDDAYDQAVRNLQRPRPASSPFDEIFGGYQ